jgi:hypothetical protein
LANQRAGISSRQESGGGFPVNDFTEDELLMCWEAVQYQLASFQFLSRHKVWKATPPEIAKYESEFPERAAKLQRLSRKIEDRMIELAK